MQDARVKKQEPRRKNIENRVESTKYEL